jgi:hypothetical protein
MYFYIYSPSPTSKILIIFYRRNSYFLKNCFWIFLSCPFGHDVCLVFVYLINLFFDFLFCGSLLNMGMEKAQFIYLLFIIWWFIVFFTRN